MKPHIFVVRGDLTDIRADVVILPTSTAVNGTGTVISAAKKQWEEGVLDPGIEAARAIIGGKGVGGCHGFTLKDGTSGLPHGVVLVATVKGSVAVQAEDVRKCATNAIRAAKDLIAERRKNGADGPGHWYGNNEQRAIVAIGSLATGDALGVQEAGEFARAQMEGVRAALDDSDPLDVVIVAWDDDGWARFVGARNADEREGRAWAQLPSALAHAVQRDACVLFVGAGLSLGAGLPDWNGLIERMEKELQDQRVDLPPKSGDHNLYNLEVAEAYAKSGNEHYAKIGELYGPTKTRGNAPTLAHYLLLSLPFRYVVTTNYDSLVERTLRALRKPSRMVVKDAEVSLSGEQGAVTVFKIHGHATDQGAEEVVLTKGEYEHFGNHHPAKAALLQALLLNHHFFFVGYRLGDPNLNAVREQVSNMLKRTSRHAWRSAIHEKQETQPTGVEALEFTDSREFAIALDAMASSFAGRSRTLFANQGDAPTERLKHLHTSLQEAGSAALELVRDVHKPPLSHLEANAAFQVLEDLAALGWRPPESDAGARFKLWRSIAQRAPAGSELAARAWRLALEDAANNDQIEEAMAGVSLALPMP